MTESPPPIPEFFPAVVGRLRPPLTGVRGVLGETWTDQWQILPLTPNLWPLALGRGDDFPELEVRVHVQAPADLEANPLPYVPPVPYVFGRIVDSGIFAEFDNAVNNRQRRAALARRLFARVEWGEEWAGFPLSGFDGAGGGELLQEAYKHPEFEFVIVAQSAHLRAPLPKLPDAPEGWPDEVPELPERPDEPCAFIRSAVSRRVRFLGREFGYEWTLILVDDLPPHQVRALSDEGAVRVDLDVQLFLHGDPNEYLLEQLAKFDKRKSAAMRKRVEAASQSVADALAEASKAAAARAAADEAHQVARRAVDEAENAFAADEAPWDAVEGLTPHVQQARVKAKRAQHLANVADEAAEKAKAELREAEADVAEVLRPLAVDAVEKGIAAGVEQARESLQAFRDALETIRAVRETGRDVTDECSALLRNAGRPVGIFTPPAVAELASDLAAEARRLGLPIDSDDLTNPLTYAGDPS